MDLTLSLPGGLWERIRSVRERVAEACAELPVDVRAAAVMVTSELVENAVKYGVAVPGLDEIVVRFRIGAGHITVEVANGVATRAAYERVAAHIERIRQAPSCAELYIARLQDLMCSPGASGGLGLYRMGFEGEFDLYCECDGQVLTVCATRKLP